MRRVLGLLKTNRTSLLYTDDDDDDYNILVYLFVMIITLGLNNSWNLTLSSLCSY